MSLNCLTCQGMKRTDSDVDMRARLCQGKPNMYRFLATVERSWSGNLAPRPNNNNCYDQSPRSRKILMADKKVKKGNNYRIHTNSAPADLDGIITGAAPRLVRSSGMRRDWSFEDLRRVNGYYHHK